MRKDKKTMLKHSNLGVEVNQKTAQVKNHRADGYELHVYQKPLTLYKCFEILRISEYLIENRI